MGLLDEFFGKPAKAGYGSAAAREFFAAHSGAREKKAREALKSFEKLPERVQVAIFERAGVDRRRLFELSPRERVKLLEAAEKIMDEIAVKLGQAKAAVSSIALLVAFKGDRAG